MVGCLAIGQEQSHSLVQDLKSRQQPEGVRAAGKPRLRGCPAHLALWTETEGGNLKSPGQFQPSDDPEIIQHRSPSDLRPSKPPALPPSLRRVQRPLCCEWSVSVAAHLPSHAAGHFPPQ